MSLDQEAPLDRLWQEYGQLFRRFDDLTLARWMAQTLGQLKGQIWRFSHPLIGAYRLAAQVGHERGIWLKRLATPPIAYVDAECCRAPLLPLITRDVRESGLVCQHCASTAVTWDDIPKELRLVLNAWSKDYLPVHEVAHWDEERRQQCKDYDQAYESAAKKAERFLERLGHEIAPLFLEHFAVVVWEDQDECLEVRPEDLHLDR
jgi:hypothetical protein